MHLRRQHIKRWLVTLIALAAALVALDAWVIAVGSPPTQSGRYVGEAVRFYEFRGTGEGALVFEIGKIAHQWVMGETRP